jgi:5-methylcytosine-specific restriction enzyme A
MYTGRRTVPLPGNWGAIRYRVLIRDPTCQWGVWGIDGEDARCGQPSTEADHIGDAWDHRDEVLRGLCHAHHMIRTSRQANAERSRMRDLRKRPQERHPGLKRIPLEVEEFL